MTSSHPTPPSEADWSLIPTVSLLESGFPTREIGERARLRRHRPNVVYGAHKWWARRPAPSVRALLLAAACRPDQADDFWVRYEAERDASWQGGRVGDPFVGGGTSLVEAQRLGAAVYGVDVDPLAVMITEHELEHLDLEEFQAAAQGLLRHLRDRCGDLYPTGSSEQTPLHYFSLREVTCPACGVADFLFKSLVIARDLGRQGAVVRDAAIVAFCPACLRLHELHKGRKTITCCQGRVRLVSSTYAAGRYQCTCGVRSTHEELRTGMARSRLLAVEVTTADGRRRIRPPTSVELNTESKARQRLKEQWASVVVPRKALSGALKQYKPGIYGYSTYDELFTSRQLIVFGTAFHWLRDQLLSRRVKSAVALAVSNALASNNQLCGYATDYGRLSPLFSIRDYSIPALSVELNPLHPSAGRGTLPATLRRVALSKRDETTMDTRDSSVAVADAALVVWPDTGGLDLVLTDPPYFDYIAYSDLSSFFRAWLEAAELIDSMDGGRPLFTGADSRAAFADRLGQCFSQARARLKPGGMLAFTYHASSADGWAAVASAISKADLVLTSCFPLWADAHSPGHGHEGNLEYDLVFCCRSSDSNSWISQSTANWRGMLPGDKVSAPDLHAWELATSELNKFVS